MCNVKTGDISTPVRRNETPETVLRDICTAILFSTYCSATCSDSTLADLPLLAVSFYPRLRSQDFMIIISDYCKVGYKTAALYPFGVGSTTPQLASSQSICGE
jgi:hypothetical protein